MRRQDLYWLAGYLEGEGTFFYHSLSYTARIGLQSTDLDVIDRAAKLMGAVAHGPLKRGTRRKPIWYVQVYGGNARKLMSKLLPLLGNRRKKQITDALAKVDRVKR